MSPDQLRSLGLYVLWAFVGAVVATGLQLATVLSGTEAIEVRPLAATFLSSFFGAIATVLGTSQLTRLGSEPIARQVDALKTQGVPKSEMVVLAREDADAALNRPLPEVQVGQIADELERRLRSTWADPARMQP